MVRLWTTICHPHDDAEGCAPPLAETEPLSAASRAAARRILHECRVHAAPATWLGHSCCNDLGAEWCRSVWGSLRGRRARCDRASAEREPARQGVGELQEGERR